MEGEGGTSWEIGTDMDTLSFVKQVTTGHLLYSTWSSAQCSVITQRAGKEAQEGGDIGIPRADSFLCIAETNNNAKQLYPNWNKKE